ncbi:MAG: hypothetical protein HRT63_06560 [Erythrobacter sp.]|nr:hypothetical protein [Erythrobacter sp.]
MLHILTILAALSQASTLSIDTPKNAAEAFAALEGNWQGQLEYRDYQTDRMQAIPLSVEFDTIPDETTFVQRSNFTDPGFPVRITTLVNAVGETVNVANSRAGREFETYAQTARITDALDGDNWTMTLFRIDKDDNRPAAIREVMIRNQGSLTITKEVDFLDDDVAEWTFRNRVTLAAQ